MDFRVTVGTSCIIVCLCGFVNAANITANRSAQLVDADHIADVEIDDFFGVTGATNASDDETDTTTTESAVTLERTSSTTPSTTTTTAKTTTKITTSATTTKKPVSRKPKPARRRVCGCDLHVRVFVAGAFPCSMKSCIVHFSFPDQLMRHELLL